MPATNAKELIALREGEPGQAQLRVRRQRRARITCRASCSSRPPGIDITHVPYKGNGPAITDLLADRVQLLFTSTGPVEAHLKSGKLKAIAVTGKNRLASLPDVPTIAENAIPGYNFTLWYGLVVPAGTPKPIIDKLNADLRKTMASPEVKEKLASIGGNLNVGSPDEMGDAAARTNSCAGRSSPRTPTSSSTSAPPARCAIPHQPRNRMRVNESKKKAKAGTPMLGTMCNAASPLIAEWLGHSGYDFIVVDLQHGENNLDNVQMMLQALSSTPAIADGARAVQRADVHPARARSRRVRRDRAAGEHARPRREAVGGQRALRAEGRAQLGPGARRDLRRRGLLLQVGGRDS